MPTGLKAYAVDTDVANMSESALNEPRIAEGYHFDFEMPRLASEPTVTPQPTVPPEFDPTQAPAVTHDAATAPRLPGTGPATPPPPSPPVGTLPPLPDSVVADPAMPTSTPTPPPPPAAVPGPTTVDTGDAAAAQVPGVGALAEQVAAEAEAEQSNAAPHHPMAHLMPQKPEQTEASRKAAELRAAKKKKSKRIKIAMAAGVVAVGAIAGPPLASWLVDAINEAGSTGDDTPVEEQVDTPEPGADTGTPPAAPDTELGRIDDLLDETRERTADLNARQP